MLLETTIEEVLDYLEELSGKVCVEKDNVTSHLVNLYSIGRAYHNEGHITHCLTELRKAMCLIEHRPELEFAIILHDAVYNSQASNNEEKSVEKAMFLIAKLGFDFLDKEKVQSYIQVTDHKTEPTSMDERLIVDVDLSILGVEPEDFDRYESAIRKEYSWVSRDDYKVGRTRVLQSFLSKPTIYQTPTFRGCYEDDAQANIRRSIEKLSKS